jgi:hypothetical protein
MTRLFEAECLSLYIANHAAIAFVLAGNLMLLDWTSHS